MRRSIKFISVFLAALMLALAIPFSAVAESFATYDEEKLLLSLPHLGASDEDDGFVAAKDADGADITLGDIECGSNTAWSESNGDLKVNPSKIENTSKARRTWYTAVRATSLPLTESEKYTITYDAYLPSAGENYKEWTFIGFGFSKSVSTSAGNTLTFWKSQNTDLATNTLLISKNNTNPYSSGNILSNTVSNTVDFSGKHSFVLSIDGKSVTMYMDGVLCGTLTLKDGNNYNEDGKLALGMRIHADLLNVEGDACTLYNMTNIKVYNGTYDEVTTTSFENGETLLKLKTPITSTLDENGYNYKGYDDITVTQAPNNNVFNADGDNLNNVENGMTGNDTVYAKKNEAFAGKTYWFEGGAITNLPLDKDSKYTVEFYMKRHVEALNIGFFFDYVGKNNESNQGIYLYSNSIATIKGTSTKVYNVSDSTSTSLSCSNLWKVNQSADGYTRFNIEINGTAVKVFVGGKEIGTFDFGDSFNGSSLALVTKGYVTNTEKVELGSALVSVKDVTVYAGNIVSACDVRFENEAGELLNSVKKDPKSVLAATDFPTVEKGENEIVKWFYKDTNIIVLAPYEVTHDTTLVARVIDLNEIKVAGMQYTEKDGETNQQSIRFISTLHSLQGTEAGYNVTAVYKESDNSAVMADKEWNIKSTVVYSSIKAASTSGTVMDVTASELGGTYLVAIAINKVPANYAQIDFYVEAYVVVNGETITSEKVRFTMSNGVAAELDALEIPQA